MSFGALFHLTIAELDAKRKQKEAFAVKIKDSA